MHIEPTDSCPETEPVDEIRLAETAVMVRLLCNEHGDPWTRAELVRDIGGNPNDVSDALTKLNGLGVVNLSEQWVTASRAARYMDDLDL
jgi:predicted transcriptional regulator